MYIYRGKFNWGDYAKDEPFTIIFPSDFDLGEDAFASWTYWNKDQVILLGSVDSITPVKNAIGLFCKSTLWIDITFPDDDTLRKTLTANVYHSFASVDTRPSPSTLTLVYQLDDAFQLPTNSLIASPISRIYYGTLTTSNSDAKNELFILVIPNVVLATEPLCAYWMWTTTNKTNVDISGSIQTLTEKTITYTDSTAKYTIKGDNVGTESSVDITLTYSGASTTVSLKLAVTPTIARLEALRAPSSGAFAFSQLNAANFIHPLPTARNLLSLNEHQFMLAAEPKVSVASTRTRTEQNTTFIRNDLPEPVWCTMYEADASEPSSLMAWLGFGLSVVGLTPGLNTVYPVAVGTVSLIVSSIGVYDATRAGPEVPETDTLYQDDAMYRVAFRDDTDSNLTTNAAIFIRVHVVGETTLVISRAQKSRLPRRVLTSKIFADPLISKDLFSIAMDQRFEILPFRIFEIKGLVPCQGTTTADNSWFEGPSAVSFSRGEMATVNTSTTDRKTLTRHGQLSVAYDEDDDLFKYVASTLFLCVEDKQTLLDDGYDFFWVSNTDKGVFLRLAECTVKADKTLAKDCGIIVTSDNDTLRVQLEYRFRDFDIYWLEEFSDDSNKLWAAKFELDPNIIIKPKPDSSGLVLVRVTNWYGGLRMSKLS